ncbi:hypothetical protein RVX_R07840 [Nitratidesulfovibrio sp. HK-II]|uniref:hypothetical protein n=1 Tax=Nitratidesulfovibrio sp. HK-II TaxID=2009266 RepID=UPI000E2FF258|nr:hypothetical protein [Nitratidesulfovibrio sp. HK-II]GBO95061.1 hypothetical protein RVX_0104 [Nitratidesulfovibrio sp. HK-II]
MLELDFTTSGYIYMALIWACAGIGAAVLARRQGRNPLLWCAICLVAPIALFYLAGEHSGREDARARTERARTERAQTGREQPQTPADGKDAE